MSDSNVSERTTVQLGVQTLAVELDGSPGDALVLDADLRPVPGAAGGGAFVVRRVEVGPDWPNTPTLLLTMPGGGVSVGDMLYGYLGFVTTAFNGTTPKLKTYFDEAGQPVDEMDATVVADNYDSGYAGGIHGPPGDMFGFYPGAAGGLGLVAEESTFLLSLHDGASGDPGSTVGAAEYWFFFVKRPS